ncbi:MAG: MotA/TolQ/ExbB proton channel family protein [Reichenbachiella sp.]
MMDLYLQGGSLFMGILTLLLLVVFVFSILNVIRILNKESFSEFHLQAVKSVGLFALVVGVLGQLIGLYSAFEIIAEVGEISQQKLAAGIRVSSITTLYGMLIFLISYAIWFGLSYWSRNK